MVVETTKRGWVPPGVLPTERVAQGVVVPMPTLPAEFNINLALEPKAVPSTILKVFEPL